MNLTPTDLDNLDRAFGESNRADRAIMREIDRVEMCHWRNEWVLLAVICWVTICVIWSNYDKARDDHALSKRITTLTKQNAALTRRVAAAQTVKDAPKPAALRLEPRGGLPALKLDARFLSREGERP